MNVTELQHRRRKMIHEGNGYGHRIIEAIEVIGRIKGMNRKIINPSFESKLGFIT
jgi:hypothetical protein